MIVLPKLDTSLMVFLLMCVGSFAAAAEQNVSFNSDIRPILSDKCYFCHGPDDESRAAEVRFDTPDGGREAMESGEFLSRIQSDDPDYHMPPPQTKLTLTDEEKQQLEAWVESGAPYDSHWAFEDLPHVSPELPAVSDTAWAKHPLDRFILARLEKESLQPTAEADPLRWLRRVSFDLTGLPPTVEAVRSFQRALQTDRELAYEQVVDRLLASTSFGEHMAVGWLDVARYADSYGYQSDKLNTQWPYRDWVVNALNDNLPYDDFLIWQIAGDLLENPTREQRLATAFNRIHRLNNEGGAVFEEWRQENVADRVHTFGTAILGLTLECSRCHDHKYDPITQRDYYSLSAFFNSIDENGLYDRTEKVPSPTMLLPTDAQAAELLRAQERQEVAASDFQRAADTVDRRWQAWQTAAQSQEKLTIPDLQVAVGFEDVETAKNNKQDSSWYFCANDRGHTQNLELVDVSDSPVPALANTSGGRRAVRLDGERGMLIKGVKPFDRWVPFSLVVTFKETQRSPLRSVIAHHTRGTDAGYNGWDLTIVDGFVESRLYRVWPGNGIGMRTKQPIPADRWQQLAATYDGSSQPNGLKIYLNGELLETEVLRSRITKSANVLVDHGGEMVIGQRFRARGFTEALIDDVRVYNRALVTTELRHLATGSPLQLTREYFASALDNTCRKALAELTDAHQAFVLAEEAMNEIPVMEELPEPRPAHILARGEYDAPTSDETLVRRNTFTAIMPKFSSEYPQDRLGLAQWVTRPDHPLTSRVIVNRLWMNFFPAGLVGTPENFGLQGEMPTHPQLLDWLSRDFVDHGWEIKRFCKNVVLSATYRQDSAVSGDRLAIDPENRLLSRGPAYRLSAEEIRDLALVASGLLNQERGGPPVSPYQPGDDLWRESNSMSPPYKQSVGESLHRRSLYSVWKRTAPLPNMMAFDSTSREVCTVARSRTNTPLQALVLLNDVQFVEAARELAVQVCKEQSDDEARIAAAFLAFASREPDSKEREVLKQLLAEELAYYGASPDETRELLGLGDVEDDPSERDVELAAMTVVCQAILNLDSTIWSR